MIKNKYPTIKPSLNLDFENTKSLDPRVTFRRGTPGTYYDGVTHVKAEENLLSNSEDLSGWNTTANLLNPVAVADASPIGTQAYKFIAEDAVATHAFGYRDLSNLNRSEHLTAYSIHVKADGLNYAWFGTCWNGNSYVSFVVDLTTGQVLNNLTRNRDNILIDTDVTDIGDGWYRVKYVTDNHVANYMSIGGFFNPDTDLPNDGRPYFQGDNTSGILLWGAQIEDRGYVTSYTTTNGTPITRYQPQLMTAAADRARFDHDPLTGESKGLLIEEQRTNIFEYSEDLDIIQHHGDIIVNREHTIAPDGSICGSIIRYFESDGNIRPGQHVYLSYNLSSSEIYTTSFYAKAINQANITINTGSCVVLFDLQSLTHTVLQNDENAAFQKASIEPVGNDWYRCAVTATGSGTWSQYQISPWVSTTEKIWDKRYHNGDSKSGAFIWGIQLEQGGFATSYIKTTGSQATRSADDASIVGENFSSWYRQDQGSLYVDSAKGNLGTNFAGYVSLHTEDFSNSEYYWLLHNSSDQFQFLVAPGIASLTDGIDASLDSQKVCVSWADDDFRMSVNGNTIQSDTDGPAKKNLTGLRIGFSPYSNSHYLNSHIKKIAYYPQRLTNEQLQNLTR